MPTIPVKARLEIAQDSRKSSSVELHLALKGIVVESQIGLTLYVPLLSSGGWASPDNVEMCYNGAKTWQLGWRPTLDIDPIGDGTGLTLTSFNDWDENASDEVCIVRIVAQSKLFFVHYNRAVGMNAGVQEYANLVLVSQRSSSEEYVDGDSQLLAALGSGGSFNQPDAGGTGHEMVVTVNSINGATANVDVTFPTLTPQTPSPVMVPQTPAPVVALTPGTWICSMFLLKSRNF